jgi:hypothetical protein
MLTNYLKLTIQHWFKDTAVLFLADLADDRRGWVYSDLRRSAKSAGDNPGAIDLASFILCGNTLLLFTRIAGVMIKILVH